MDIQTYLLYSSVILAFLSIFYWLLLRKETFFKANRWLLLGNILLALAIPLLPKPAYVIQLKADLVESFQPAIIETPVVSVQENIPIENNSFSPSNEVIELDSPPVEIATTRPSPLSSTTLLNWVYLIGFCIMLFRFLIQIYSVYQQIKRSEVTKGAGYYLATNNKDIAPFSFWKYIVINPNKYDETSFIQILEHERIHIIQRHTFDLVVAEFFLMVQWFNPLAWWHRHLIGQNLEFLVDQTLLDNGENKQTYQYHLVQVAVPNSPLSISSNYNASQLKNRIKMMNLQRSSLAASWKYALLLPITFLLLVAFAPQSQSIENEQVNNLDALYIVITEDAKITEIKEKQAQLLTYGVNLIFEELTYNTDNKIEAIKAVLQAGNTFGSVAWPKEKKGFKSLVLFKNWRTQNLGTGFAEELFEVIENRPENSALFIIGAENTPTTLNKLRAISKKAQEAVISKQQRLQADPAWKGEWFKESTNFSECSTHMLEQLKMEFLNSTKTTYTFRVNGIEWDETALEIPAESIGAYTITDEGYALPNEQGLPSRTNRKVTKREIHIIRKAQSIPRAESKETSLEEIYIILTEEASLEEIKEVQEELLELGVKLSLFSIKYNDTKTKIESIRVLFESDGNTGMVSWENGNAYNFLVVGKKSGSTFSGKGATYLQEIKTRKKDSKLFILGKENNQQTISFLDRQVDKNQQLFLAKQKELANDPNWKGYENTNSQTYIKLTTKTIIEIKDKIKHAHPKKLNYYVDGVEWEAEALDIPTEKIDEIMWFEKNLTKYDGEGEISSEVIAQLNIFVSRKTKEEKPKAKKGYQYFKECDCYIPKTFSPNNGENTFKIEGVKISGTSSFQVYDRWGEKVYDTTPFNNDWNGINDYGTVLKQATYYFTFQAEEGEEVAQGYFKIVTENTIKTSKDFVHQPDTTHYLLIPCTAESFESTKNMIKPSLFMLGMAKTKRYSNIYLGSDKNKPLFIIRKFNNFEQAEQLRVNFKNINSKLPNLKLLSISQQNYREVLKQKSIVEYEKFYKEEILK